MKIGQPDWLQGSHGVETNLKGILLIPQSCLVSLRSLQQAPVGYSGSYLATAATTGAEVE